jgi:hypothetical protein
VAITLALALTVFVVAEVHQIFLWRRTAQGARVR